MTGKVGLIGLTFLTIFIFGNFYLKLTNSPSRTQSARLEPFGEISVHLETQPDPPKTGAIPLILHITDSDGKSIAVDKVHYEYSFQNRAVNLIDGEAIGAGTFKTIATLTDVGEWQVRVTVFKDTQQMQVNFILRVMANI